MDEPRDELSDVLQRCAPGEADRIGVIIVDHGSRRAESNDMLLRVVDLYRRDTAFSIVEPAHMELAEPSIATAFDRCVEQGATRVIVMPYFLLPGRHWHEDIPGLTAEAASRHEGVGYIVTAPLGLSRQITSIIDNRIADCLSVVAGQSSECGICQGTGRCQWWHGAGEALTSEAEVRSGGSGG